MSDLVNIGYEDTGAEKALATTPDATTTETTSTTTTPPLTKYEIERKGKKIEIPLDQAKDFVQKGYDYSELMRELKAEKEAIENSKKQFSELGDMTQLKYLSDLDKRVRENPRLAEKIRETYEQFSQIGDAALSETPASPREEVLMKELSELKTWKDQQERERQDLYRQKEDETLNKQVSDTVSQFEKLGFNFALRGNDGLTLEQQVLNHMVDAKLPNFRAAFLDLKFEDLLTKSKEEAIKQTAEKLQGDREKIAMANKLLSRSSANLTPRKNIKNATYDELFDMALKEINKSGG